MSLAVRARMLEAASLETLDHVWSGEVPTPADAWRLIIAGGVTPTAAVPMSEGGEYLEQVEVLWRAIAEQHGLFGSDGEFLVSVAGAETGDLPWARVKMGMQSSMARHLVQHPGEPEFVAMSTDGRVVCGATTEEYDVWIVCRIFT